MANYYNYDSFNMNQYNINYDPYYYNWYARSDCSSSISNTSNNSITSSIPSTDSSPRQSFQVNTPLYNSSPLINYQLNTTQFSSSNNTFNTPNSTHRYMYDIKQEKEQINEIANISCDIPCINDSQLDNSSEKFVSQILPLLNSEEGQNKRGASNKRRVRTTFTFDQRKYLLNVFEEQIYPSKDLIDQLSTELDVSASIIQTWFKNMRAKKKKLTKTCTLTINQI